MQPNREILEGQLKTYQDKLKCLSSYDKELIAMTARHSTPKPQYESDLIEAEHNIEFYESEIDRIKKALGSVAPVGRPGSGGRILRPQIKKPSIGAAVFSSISFVAGALVGSRLRSGKGKDK
jgi:hypothetical protein